MRLNRIAFRFRTNPFGFRLDFENTHPEQAVAARKPPLPAALLRRKRGRPNWWTCGRSKSTSTTLHVSRVKAGTHSTHPTLAIS